MIDTPMSGRAIDKNLKAINDAANTNNNGKVVYINNGELAFEDGEKLFDVSVTWEDE